MHTSMLIWSDLGIGEFMGQFNYFTMGLWASESLISYYKLNWFPLLTKYNIIFSGLMKNVENKGAETVFNSIKLI